MTVFEEMTLGKRIASGIALMLVLMLVVGGAGYYGLSRVDAVMQVYTQVNSLQRVAAAFRDESNKYMLFEMQDDTAGQETAYDAAFSLLGEGNAMLNSLESESGITAEDAQDIAMARDAMETYKTHFEAYVAANSAKTDLAGQAASEFEEIFKEVDGAEFWKDNMVFTARIMSNFTSSYFNRASEANWSELEKGINEFAAARDDWAEKTSNSEVLKKRAERIQQSLEAYENSVNAYREKILHQDSLRNAMDREQEVLFTACKKLGESAEKKLQAQAGFSNKVIFYHYPCSSDYRDYLCSHIHQKNRGQNQPGHRRGDGGNGSDGFLV
jgi:hypothetical protein